MCIRDSLNILGVATVGVLSARDAVVSGGSTVNGNVTIGGTTAGIGSIFLPDNSRLSFGTGTGDLIVYHDGSDSYISDVGTGALNIRSSNIYLEKANGAEVMASFIADGAATLYHDASVKLATTSSGATITGTATSTTGFTTAANTRVQSSSGMLFLNGPSALTFEVGAGSEKMRLTSTGLGIGTSSPAAKLDVRGVTWTYGSGDGTIVQKLGQLDSNASTPLFNIYTDDAGSTRSLGGDALEFNTARYGQVIGATRGSAAGANVRAWKFTQATNGDERGAVLLLYSQADSSSSGSTTTSARVHLSATSNQNSYIQTTGNFGLGTATPAAALHVRRADSLYSLVESVGDYFPSTRIKRSGGSSKTNYEWEFQLGSSGNLNFKDITNSYYPIILNANGDVRISSDTSGNNPVVFADRSTSYVGIGTTAPSKKLHVEHSTGCLLYTSDAADE